MKKIFISSLIGLLPSGNGVDFIFLNKIISIFKKLSSSKNCMLTTSSFKNPDKVLTIGGSKKNKALSTMGIMNNGECLIVHGFNPTNMKTSLTLVDILEKEVPEKYFLSDKMTAYLTGKENND